MDKRFARIFAEYGGDYEKTIERVAGDEKLYLRLLKLLFADDNLAKLGEAIEGGDYEEAFIAAHTLKGVTGNLGLEPLYLAVCAIVEPLRRHDQNCDYAHLYTAVLNEFDRVKKLRQALEDLS